MPTAALVLAVALALVIPVAGAHAASVRSFSPQGEAPVVRQACAVFSAPMAELGRAGAASPFSIECAIPGRGHWADPATWVYDMRSAGGPMFELVLRQGCRLMFLQRKLVPGLKTLARLIGDKELRTRALEEASDPESNTFWLQTYAKLGGDMGNEANWTVYVTSKFTRLLQNELVAPVIDERRPTFDFRKLMDERGILVINLAKGRVGGSGCSFLGLPLVNLILRAALSRQSVPEAQRRDFFLYVDEFQNLATEAVAELLAEARKFRLGMVLANQYLDQIPGAILRALMGNVGTLLSLRVGVKDAELLEEWFAPAVSRQDLANLPNFHAYVKTLVGGEAVTPFDVALERPPEVGAVGRGVSEFLCVRHTMTTRSQYAKPTEEGPSGRRST